MKRILFLLLAALLPAHGADLQRGVTFSDGQRITAAELHELVDDAVILPSFISGQSAASSLAGGDLLLMYSGSALYKIAANTALYQNTAIITGLTAKTQPASTDYFLLYDATGAALKKVTLDNLTWNNPIVYTNLFRYMQSNYVLPGITNLPLVVIPEYLSWVFVNDGGTNKRMSPHNLLAGWQAIVDYNNLTAQATLPLYQPTGVEAGDKTVTLQNLGGHLQVAGGFFAGTRFQSFDYDLAAGVVANTNHSLSGSPSMSRWVLVCQTNDTGGYLVGDEVEVQNFYDTGTQDQRFTTGANSTNTWLTLAATTTIGTRAKTNSAEAVITAVRWKARNYATRLNF